jgi:hypothetical protein
MFFNRKAVACQPNILIHIGTEVIIATYFPGNFPGFRFTISAVIIADMIYVIIFLYL